MMVYVFICILFLVPASAPQLANKGRGMFYPVYGMVHIK